MNHNPGWRKYECPLCKGQWVDREPKESQPPCKLCGHMLSCIDENYGRFMTAPCNLGIGAGALKMSREISNPFVGVTVYEDLGVEKPNYDTQYILNR